VTPDDQSSTVDFRNLGFERSVLQGAIIAFVGVVALILLADLVIWLNYGLYAVNSSLTAQGTFALPIVTGIAALGAGYGFFRSAYKGVPLFGDLPSDVKKAIEELGRPPPPVPVRAQGVLSARVDAVGEDRTAPSSNPPSTPPKPPATGDGVE
jgi:hypothetical protein